MLPKIRLHRCAVLIKQHYYYGSHFCNGKKKEPGSYLNVTVPGTNYVNKDIHTMAFYAKDKKPNINL